MSKDRGPWSGMPTKLPEYIETLAKIFGSTTEAMAVNIFYRCSRSRAVTSFGVCNNLLQKEYNPNRDGFKEYLADVWGLNQEDAEKITKFMERESR